MGSRVEIAGLRVQLKKRALSAALLARSDLVVICTDHDKFDYALIAANSRLLLDTRGVLR